MYIDLQNINTFIESKPVTLTDLSEHVMGVNEVVKVLKETDTSQYWKVPGKEYSSGCESANLIIGL